jgi:hypothetical protein
MIRTLVLVIAFSVGLAVFAGRPAVAQESLSISGTVWEDLNANGVRDPEDPPMMAFVSLTSVPFARGTSMWTDTDGRYEFSNVPPGRHVIQLRDSRRLYWTHPARAGSGDYTITVNVTSQSVTGVDFGVHRPEEHIAFAVDTWVFAVREGGGEVKAFIGGADCTGPVQGILPPGTVRFAFSVISSELDPACGDPGDVIRFEVGGLPANETAIWEDRSRPGNSIAPNFIRLTLTVGPPFAYLTLDSTTPSGKSEPPEEGSVAAYIDGERCAANEGYGQGGSMIVLRSTAYSDGCGYDGATIVLMRDGAKAARITWQEGYLGEVEVPWVPRPDLLEDPSHYEWVYGYPPPVETGTVQQILPPSVGDGGLLP